MPNATALAIRRAQRLAAGTVGQLIQNSEREIEELYTQALADLEAELERYTDAEGRIPLDALGQVRALIESRLAELGESRDRVIRAGLGDAARLGADPWSLASEIDASELTDQVLTFIDRFTDANGLQLSDRLWRLDRSARERVTEAIESAVIQGHGAARAALDLISRGETVPEELLAKRGMSRLERVRAGVGSALMTGEGAPYYNAERVMRTELNRAWGEAGVQAAAQHPDVIGVKFVLSPMHPKPDICDFHAEANLHGLGPGVYPVDNHPWPAHPNTLSYLEPVFRDEVSDEDRDGRESVTDFLNRQPKNRQIAILGGKAKAWAWREGQLDPRQIDAPWREIAQKLKRKGVKIPEVFEP